MSKKIFSARQGGKKMVDDMKTTLQLNSFFEEKIAFFRIRKGPFSKINIPNKLASDLQWDSNIKLSARLENGKLILSRGEKT